MSLLKNKLPETAAVIMTAVCILIVLAQTLICRAYAQQPVDTVKVGYFENEVFQEGAGEGQVRTGYAYEYYQKLAEYTGWRYEYVYGDFGELYEMLVNGEIDLLAGLAYTEERKDIIGYPEAPMGNETYSLVKHDTDPDITAMPSTLAGKRIGVLDSVIVGVLENYLDSHGITALIVPFSAYSDLFAAFDSGNVDVLAAEGDGAYGRENAEVVCAFGKSDYYLCVNPRRADLLSELDSAQAELASSEPNYINLLKIKYYSVSVSGRAFSTEEKEWLNEHSTMRIGYLNNYLSYSDTDKDGNVTGLIKDLMPEMISSLGIEGLDVTYTGYVRYDDMIAAMSDGRIDAAFPVGGGLYYSEISGICQSNPVLSSPTELIYRGEYSSGTVVHFAVNENNRMQYYYVMTNFPDSEVTLYPSIEQCLDAVLSGKAGCTTLNGVRANDILKNSRYRDLSMKQLSSSDARCFGVMIGSEGLLKLLNRGVNVVGSDYVMNTAYKYTTGLYEYTFADMLGDYSWLFAIIVIAVAALIILFLTRESARNRQEMQAKENARITLEAKNKELAESRAALIESNEKLGITACEAERANLAKTYFLSSMSHDIRTPMNSILSMNEMILRESDEDVSTIPEIMYRIDAIDVASGMRHCGTPYVYMATVRTFLDTAYDNADEMEGYLNGGDMHSLTVKVHALKSTSRVIGAKELGTLAEALEKAGNEGDEATLRGGIGKLLADYRSLADELSPVRGPVTDDDKPQMSMETLREAYAAILEFSESLDYDSMVYVIRSLDGYAIPDGEKERVNKLMNAALGFDYELIPEILKEI